MDELLKPVLEDVYGVGSVQLCSASSVNPTLSVEVVIASSLYNNSVE